MSFPSGPGPSPVIVCTLPAASKAPSNVTGRVDIESHQTLTYFFVAASYVSKPLPVKDWSSNLPSNSLPSPQTAERHLEDHLARLLSGTKLHLGVPGAFHFLHSRKFRTALRILTESGGRKEQRDDESKPGTSGLSHRTRLCEMLSCVAARIRAEPAGSAAPSSFNRVCE